MIKKWLREYIQANKRDLIIVISFIILGIIIGVGLYIFSSTEVKQLAVNTVKEVFEISKDDSYIKTNIILNGIKENLILILILGILSVTLFGKWVTYIIVTLKGVSISFYTILLFNIFGPWWGILTSILLVVLVNIIYLPAFIFLVVMFLDINFNVFKAKIKGTNLPLLYRGLVGIIVSCIIMFSSIIVEQISSSIVLNIYTKL